MIASRRIRARSLDWVSYVSESLATYVEKSARHGKVLVMTKTVRLGVLAAGAVAMMLVGTLPLDAQEAKPSPKAESAGRPAAKRSNDTSRRVPPFFAQLGLTPEQKEDIYTIRRKHQDKLDALAKQLADVQAEMLTECESVLDDTQKKMLETRRNTKRPAAKARASTAAREESTADKDSVAAGKDSAKSSR